MRGPLTLHLLVTCAVLGCGSAGNNDPDKSVKPAPAPGVDTKPSAKPKQSRLSLRYVGRQGPVANVTVVFHDAEGAVLETTATDPNGIAFSVEGVAAQATVLEPDLSRPSLLTYTGLEAGDEIVLAPSAVGAGFLSATLPMFAGATRYHLDANGCAGERLESPGTHTVFLGDCAKSAIYTLLGVARDDNNTPLAYAYRSGVAPSGMKELAWEPPTEATVDLLNGSPSTAVTFRHVFDGQSVGTVGGSDAKPAVLRIAAQATEIDLELFDRTKVAGLETERTLVQRTTVQPSIKADFAGALPAPTELGAGTNGAKHHAFTWDWPSPVDAAGGAFSANWMRAVAQGSKSVANWTFVVPPSATSVAAPSLPPDLAGLIPPGAPAILTLEFSASTIKTDYRAFRAHYRDGGTPYPVKSRTRTSKE